MMLAARDRLGAILEGGRISCEFSRGDSVSLCRIIRSLWATMQHSSPQYGKRA